MRKGRDGKKRGEKKKTDENSGHYVIASSRPPERRPLERRTLAPIKLFGLHSNFFMFLPQPVAFYRLENLFPSIFRPLHVEGHLRSGGHLQVDCNFHISVDNFTHFISTCGPLQVD